MSSTVKEQNIKSSSTSDLKALKTEFNALQKLQKRRELSPSDLKESISLEQSIIHITEQIDSIRQQSKMNAEKYQPPIATVVKPTAGDLTQEIPDVKSQEAFENAFQSYYDSTNDFFNNIDQIAEKHKDSEKNLLLFMDFQAQVAEILIADSKLSWLQTSTKQFLTEESSKKFSDLIKWLTSNHEALKSPDAGSPRPSVKPISRSYCFSDFFSHSTSSTTTTTTVTKIKIDPTTTNMEEPDLLLPTVDKTLQ